MPQPSLPLLLLFLLLSPLLSALSNVASFSDAISISYRFQIINKANN